jgi:hypothetical protein
VKLDVLTKVAALLREKKASAEGSIIRGAWNAATGAAGAAGKHLAEKGHRAIGTAVKYTPHAAAALGAKKVYESNPVQEAIYKFRVWKANRDQQNQGY